MGITLPLSLKNCHVDRNVTSFVISIGQKVLHARPLEVIVTTDVYSWAGDRVTSTIGLLRRIKVGKSRTDYVCRTFAISA